jgi:hypothetical protein
MRLKAGSDGLAERYNPTHNVEISYCATTLSEDIKLNNGDLP